MLPLVDYIKTALSQTDSLEQAQNFLPMSFKKDFPIAYIHSQTRMPDPQTQEAFKDLLDENGFTPSHPTEEYFSFVKNKYPNLIQTVSYMCLKKESKDAIFYTNKFKNDYWKKIKDVGHISAFFDISRPKNEKLCEAEFTLREVIRKRKEVHALKGLSFIYLAESTEDISKVFEHYFGKKFEVIKDRYYVGYSKTLKEINMRYFVCQPK